MPYGDSGKKCQKRKEKGPTARKERRQEAKEANMPKRGRKGGKPICEAVTIGSVTVQGGPSTRHHHTVGYPPDRKRKKGD